MVGLGVDFDDVTDYVARQRPRHRGAAPCDARPADGQAGSCSRAAWSCTAKVGSTAPTHGVVRPPPRDPSRPRRRPVRADVPAVRATRSNRSRFPRTRTVDPRNVYAATKLHQEHLCSAFAREHAGVAVTALRYHNVYGPRMPRNTPYAGVASIFRSAFERGDVPQVFEDGGQLRDFVHVRDIARANVLALTSDEPPFRSVQHRDRRPRTPCSKWPTSSPVPSASTFRPAGGNWRLAGRRCPSRVCRGHRPRSTPRFPGRDQFRRRNARVRDRRAAHVAVPHQRRVSRACSNAPAMICWLAASGCAAGRCAARSPRPGSRRAWTS